VTDRRAALLELHRRVLAGDPSASSELFSTIHRPVVSVLVRIHSRRLLPPEDAGDLATDALVDYLRHPGKYDPERSSLFSYLCMIAKGDALNLFQARRREREKTLRVVELSHGDRNIADMDTCNLDAETIISRYGAELFDDEHDVQVLKLMLAGEKDTDTYASAIGLGGATQAAKNAAVKQRRDRLEKRLRRLGARL
jgi:DNA-directed RNA polymerase specialized sigma24 family protein